MIGMIACFPSKNLENVKPLDSLGSIKANLTLHDPILIDDSGAGWPPLSYTWAEAVLETWCSGEGTENSPYIIENLMIDSDGDSSCILVRNSDVYFIIQNCEFSGMNASAWYKGAVQIETASNGKIIGNLFTNNLNSGVVLRVNCHDIIVEENTFYNNKNSILVRESLDITIFNNLISLNYIGINSGASTGIIMDSNIITKNTRGISSTSINDVITKNNVSLNEEEGILIESSGCSITENIADKNDVGIQLQYSYSNIITKNQANNNRIGINLLNSYDNNITENTLLNNEDCIHKELSDDNLIQDNNCGSNTILIPGYPPILVVVLILSIGMLIWITYKRRKTLNLKI